MKTSLSSLELHYLVRELQTLIGARLDKVYQGLKEQKRDLLLQFNKMGEGKVLLRIVLPGVVYRATKKPEYEKMPGGFAIFLRRRIGNARLVALRQVGFERILELEFENKNGGFFLILELIPPGNALLLNRGTKKNEGKNEEADEKIIGLLEPQRHGQRLLRGGVKYTPPPPSFNTKEASEEEIKKVLSESKLDSIVKSVARELGFGGLYAEEVCLRANIDKNSSNLTTKDSDSLTSSIKEMFKAESAPFFIGKEVFPFKLQSKRGDVGVEREVEELDNAHRKEDEEQSEEAEPREKKEKDDLLKEKKCSSFSEAIEEVIAPSLETEVEVKRVTEKNENRRKKKRQGVIEKQEAQLKRYLRAAEENQRKGELIYEHYSEIAKLLKEINTERKKRSWKEVKDIFKDKVVDIEENEGRVTIDLN